jgi:uncharacterized protein YbjT (DUF2867 family)
VPVVILGGQPFVAKAVSAAMSEVSPEVRAVVSRPEEAEPLRTLGAKVAVGATNDPDLLDAVLAGAHTVCLLGSSRRWWDEQQAHRGIVRNTEVILDRARAARIRRVLAVGWAPSSNSAGPYDRAGAERRALIEEGGIPYVFVRHNLVYGPGSAMFELIVGMARARPRARVIGPGTQRWAPVSVDDLARVLAGADDRANVESGSYGLDGPDQIVVDDLVDVLAGRRRAVRRHVTKPGRYGTVDEGLGMRLGNELLDYLSGDIVAGPPSAAEEFGVEPTPLREGLARALG